MRGEVIGPWPDAVLTVPILLYFGMFFCAGALLFRYPILRTLPALVAMLIAGVYFLRHGRDVIGLAMVIPAVVIAIGVEAWPALRTAARFGDLSYGIYIYAWPVQQLLICWLGKETNYFVLIVPTLALTIGLAYLSWHWVESVALRLKPRATDPTSALPKPQVAIGDASASS
jgi:peptidoglycan/LPS O-acetylase OafA/YrhL